MTEKKNPIVTRMLAGAAAIASCHPPGDPRGVYVGPELIKRANELHALVQKIMEERPNKGKKST